ncbi:MAG TPA: serine/threonine-protein kinase, partial [Holophaga sp.]|nr:serine/threonine-protein kinase [Holophaga sp.]HPS66993.1 serine/threonine-protein kinase [Holophaga sp.]
MLDEQEQARIIGMALVRGLIGVEALKAVAARGDRGLLDALMDAGRLDEIDVEDLRGIHESPFIESARSPGGRSDLGRDADDPSLQFPAGEPPPEPEDGRVVREAYALPRWKNYQDLCFVAGGGLGRIFAAFDPSLKRTVALKFLLWDDPELVRRFSLEAQHQAKVDHPNICKVFEVGEWKGQAYIAMQYIHGETLEAAASRMSLTEKIEIMEIVAEALNAAHREGLIHRDIKPANIMIEWLPGGKPKPYVLDFGLARGVEPSELTLDGMLIGTTNYMAPEQAAGQFDKVGRRSDVYGLGATLFRILTGRMVNQGAGGPSGEEKRAPDPVRRWNPEVSRDLETIVMKCLEKVPERRYDSALALAEDLRRCREGEPIFAHPATWFYRTGKYVRRHKSLVGMSAASLALVMALSGWALTMHLRVPRISECATSFGSEASTMMMGLRMNYLLPEHDTRPCKAWVRQRMERVRGIIQAEGRQAEGPGAFALGQGYFALRDYAAARRELEEAWRKNHRDPLVAWALGQSLGELYREGMEELRQTSDKKMRETTEHALEREFQAPALAYLRLVVAQTSERKSFVEGLLAYYEGRYLLAIAKAREASQLEPDLYEAKILEGNALVAMGLACQDAHPETSVRLLQEAGAPYCAALGMARSDPALIYAEATRRC